VELTRREALRLIEDLAELGVPVLLFSGGEPLLREDIFDLLNCAAGNGIRTVLSTNGTLITPEVAARLSEAGVAYVGISLDGPEKTNDEFRGASGAYNEALNGIRHCKAAGMKVGLRFTMGRANYRHVGKQFALAEREEISRLCFYHLVPAGRAGALEEGMLRPRETRRVVDQILDTTRARHLEGKPVEVLTVDNHCDAPYLYLRLCREDPDRAQKVMELLRMNGGNRSGTGVACVNWDGSVFPDQFWRTQSVGNVRVKPFSEIWSDPSIDLLRKLRDRRNHLEGRCGTCRWLDICNGNLRARAQALTGDMWAADPGCYLTDEEIAAE